jgi:ribosome-binding factor A
MKGQGLRSARVAQRLHEEAARAIHTLRDPRLEGLVITRVELTDDLAFARVFVRTLALEADPKGVSRALRGAASKLRRDLARTLGLRAMPELRFVYDEGQEHASRVEELLREIHDDERAAAPTEAAPPPAPTQQETPSRPR